MRFPEGGVHVHGAGVEPVPHFEACGVAGVPITNYGLTIAYSLGIFERALEPFPAALEVLAAARA